MKTRTVRMACGVAVLLAAFGLSARDAQAARAARGERPAEGETAGDDPAALQMVQRGKDALAAGDKERGVRMLQTVIQQNPAGKVRFLAYMALGRHCVEAAEFDQALSCLARVKELEKEKDLAPELKDILVESLHLTGAVYYRKRDYARVFPVLRKVTTEYPNTAWANQSYFYIGMSHFAMENWSQAVEALSLVGTYVDPESAAARTIEAGRRFYVKVEDGDLPVMVRLGFKPRVIAETKAGDREEVVLVQLSTDNPVFVGSLPTDVGTPSVGDGILQVSGGDEVTTTYIDGNTESGEKDRPRKQTVKVVSTGGIFVSLGDYDTRAKVAFIDQPVHLVLQDADLDISPHADEVKVKVVSRHPAPALAEGVFEESWKGGFADLLAQKKKDADYQVRDELVVTLREVGAGEPVRTGRFNGKFMTIAGEAGKDVDRTDDRLTCLPDDEIVVRYVDERHGEGPSSRECVAKVTVAGAVDPAIVIRQPGTPDSTVRAKKNIVEGQAWLELTRIFKDMGLRKGADSKATEVITRAEEVILTRVLLDPELREQAFRLKWESHLALEDLDAAIATCRMFNDLFPDSPLVDQALKGIADARRKQGDLRGATAVCRQILALQNSLAKAEAQFMIAECTEAMAEAQGAEAGNALEAAIPAYRTVAEKYPDSLFAGRALEKIVNYHIGAKDYVAADQLLGQICQDYPDAEFMDDMLMNWAIVSYRMGDPRKTVEKCMKILVSFPESKHAPRAKELIEKLQDKVEKGE